MWKYLGVTITNDLTWNHHINNITNKANASLRFIRERPFNLRGFMFFSKKKKKKYSDSQCCWKKYSDFGGGKKIIWFKVFVI
jgi:hypothetical protein